MQTYNIDLSNILLVNKKYLLTYPTPRWKMAKIITKKILKTNAYKYLFLIFFFHLLIDNVNKVFIKYKNNLFVKISLDFSISKKA